MKTYIYALAAGLLITMAAQATDELDATPEIHEASPETPMLDRSVKLAEPPIPLSLDMAEAVDHLADEIYTPAAININNWNISNF